MGVHIAIIVSIECDSHTSVSKHNQINANVHFQTSYTTSKQIDDFQTVHLCFHTASWQRLVWKLFWRIQNDIYNLMSIRIPYQNTQDTPVLNIILYGRAAVRTILTGKNNFGVNPVAYFKTSIFYVLVLKCGIRWKKMTYII